MIKINLLDYRNLNKKAEVEKQLACACLLFIASICIVTFISIEQNSKIETFGNIFASKQDELNALKTAVNNVKAFEEKEVILEQILDVIKVLKQNQSRTSKILNDLNDRLSSEVWLTGLIEEKKIVNIIGYSFTNRGIANFLKRLELSKHYKYTELLNSEQATIGSQKVKKFSIKSKFNIPEPIVLKLKETEGKKKKKKKKKKK